MRKHVLNIIILCGVLLNIGCNQPEPELEQEYLPILVNGNKWTYACRTYNEYGYKNDCTLIQSVCGDTIINGTSYKIVKNTIEDLDIPNVLDVMGLPAKKYYREDNGKLYLYDKLPNGLAGDVLMFDLDLDKGQGVSHCHAVSSEIDSAKVVDVFYAKTTDNKYRKGLVIGLSDDSKNEYYYNDMWVEGIGSRCSGIRENTTHTYGFRAMLNDFSIQGKVVFEGNPKWE